MKIDLNSDVGESYGAWRMGADGEVLAQVSSANIACGFHAGDPLTMRDTVALALAHGVAIGAHPSLPDLQGFGRREMRIGIDELHALTLYQIGALDGFARAAGTRVMHVKPHGALYNMAARDPLIADAIAAAVREYDARLVLVGLAASELARAGRRAGIDVREEGFVDRRYESDGSLTPRTHADALISDVDEAVAQALDIVVRGKVIARTGAVVEIRADTLCVHGDHVHSAERARRLRGALEAAGVEVSARRPLR